LLINIEIVVIDVIGEITQTPARLLISLWSVPAKRTGSQVTAARVT